MEPQIILFILNGLLGVVMLFGGHVMRSLAEENKSLRAETQRLSERLGDFVPKTEFQQYRNEQREEFREFRREQAALFDRLFMVLDDVKEQVAKKADRPSTSGMAL